MAGAADIDSALTWLRTGKSPDLELDGEFKKIDQMLPRRKKQSPEDRAREIEGCLDWMRNNGTSPFNEALPPTFDKVGSVPVSRRSPEERVADIDAVNPDGTFGDIVETV